MNNTHPRPLTLLILDGWGYSETVAYNAIAQAHTPVWDALWATAPHTLLDASGLAVGLPAGQMGNSEVGHLNLGAGRVVYQDYTRIDLAIAQGTFFDNPVLTHAIDSAVQKGCAVHIFGLLSPGGVHSHEDHILAMLDMAAQRGVDRFYLHAFLDGRDTPPQSASASLAKVEAKLAALGKGRIASLIGRYYVMDRDQRWERVQRAYDALTSGVADFQAADAQSALSAAYARGENDEFVKPTIIDPAGRIVDGDAVIFMNFRADRAREITQAFTDPDFTGFVRNQQPALSDFVTLTQYSDRFTCPVAFPPVALQQVFGAVIANHGLRQLRIAETEKYAHVTFFFNGGEETVYPGEDRVLIPSPKVATYDLQPAMSAPEVTDKLVAAITRQTDCYDVIICNFANTDMVGHTGILAAAIQAVETIDGCLARVIAASREVGGEVLITADHGNAEKLFDPETGQPHTAHTTNLVPLIYVGQRPVQMHPEPGVLSDVAPTLLTLMGLAIPAEMTGKSLLRV